VRDIEKHGTSHVFLVHKDVKDFYISAVTIMMNTYIEFSCMFSQQKCKMLSLFSSR